MLERVAVLGVALGAVVPLLWGALGALGSRVTVLCWPHTARGATSGVLAGLQRAAGMLRALVVPQVPPAHGWVVGAAAHPHWS